MSRTVPSFAEEGLKRFLHGMDRRLRDLERMGAWRFDDEEPEDGDNLAGVFPRSILDYGAPDWRYNVIARTDTTDYSAQAFDDSAWSMGTATFGATNNPGTLPRTITTTTSLDVATWIRRELPGSLSNVTVTILADNSGEAWWNGTYLGTFTLGAGNVAGDEHQFSVPPSALDSTGNVLAVRAVDDGVEPSDHHYVDAMVVASTAGLYLDDLVDVDTTTTPPVGAQVLTYDAGSGLWVPSTASSGGAGAPLLLHVRDEKVSGTAPSTPTSGSWLVRELNTVKTNEVTGASLASNQITLPAGTYEAEGTMVVGGGAQFTRTRLRNVTDATTLLVSTNGVTHNISGAPVVVPQLIRGRFTIGTTSVVEYQYRMSNAGNFGFATSMGEVEVYTDLMIRLIA